MTDEDITGFNDRVTEKLGKEQASIIADDIGILITKHTEDVKMREQQANKIRELEALNEKLANANNTLLRQIPMGSEPEPEPQKKSKTESDLSTFSLRDAFDETGRFVR